MRKRRWVIILLLTPIVLLLLGYLALQIYLATPHATRMVAAELEPLVGGPVEIDSLSLGFGGTAVTGVRIWGSEGKEVDPWASADEIEADVSLIDVITGSVMPGSVTLRGAAVTLRLGPDGNLVNPLPESDDEASDGQIPAIRLENSRLTIVQTDVEEPILDAQALGVAVTQRDGVIHLDGLSVQLAGGELSGEGSLALGEEESRVTVRVLATGLDVNQFPKSWQFPDSITGQLHGEANLTVRVDGKELTTAGSGQGEVRNATILGYPASGGKIGIRLGSDGKSFGFSTARKPPAEETSQAVPEVHLPWRELLLSTIIDLFFSQPISGDEDGLVEIDFGLENVDLKELLTKLEIPAPFEVSGELTVSVKVGIPADDTGNLASYRLDGSASLPTFQMEALRLEGVQAQVTFRDGVLHLDELSATVPDEDGAAGSFSGMATLGVEPAGALNAKLSLTDIPAARVASTMTDALTDAGGRVSGELTLQAPAEQLDDVATWVGELTMDAPSLQAFGSTFTDAHLQVNLSEGAITVPEFSGKLNETPVSASGHLGLAEPYDYNAQLQLPEADLSALNKLSPDLQLPVALAGLFRVEGGMEGTLSPMTFQTAGTASVEDLVIEEFAIGAASVAWEGDQEALTITELSGALYGGTVEGSGVIPFVKGSGGEATIEFRTIDLAKATDAVPDFPVAVEGEASGKIRADFPLDDPEGNPLVHLELQAPQLKVRKIPAEELQGTAQYEAGAIEYDLKAKALGGTIAIQGSYPLDATAPEGTPPQGRLHLHDLQADSPLWTQLDLDEEIGPLSGRIHLNADYALTGPEGALVGTGELRLENVAWDGLVLTDQLSSTMHLTGSSLAFDAINGRYANGTLGGEVVLSFDDILNTMVALTLRGADAVRLFQPVPEVAEQISGTLNVQVEGDFGAVAQGRGEVLLLRGTVAGVSVSNWRVPVRWSWGDDRGGLVIQRSAARVAHGRLRGDATFQWGDGTQLDGDLEFSDVNIETLLEPFTDTSLGEGRTSGRLTFSGRNVDAVEDLNMTLRATLPRSKPFDFPILRQMAPFLRQAQVRSGGTDQGALRATLSQGVVRIQEFSLVGRSYRLFVDGTVTLSGRVNLEAVATVNPAGGRTGFLRVLSRLVPVGGALPAKVIASVSEHLTTRGIKLKILGTVDDPSIRLNPVPVLAENAVRFFLRSVRPRN